MRYRIKNNTEKELEFPVKKTVTKKVPALKTLEGRIVEAKEELEFERTCSNRTVVLGPTHEPQNPGQVTIDEETMEEVRELSYFQKYLEDHKIDVFKVGEDES